MASVSQAEEVPSSAASDDLTTVIPESAPNSSGDQPLPDIEAKLRHLKVLKSSTSQRVYLVEFAVENVASEPKPVSNDAAEKPVVNKLLLLRNEGQNVMALRVLRDITGTNQAIAKKIREYDGQTSLAIGTEIAAIEKISDVIPPPPTAQDRADMAEVEPDPLAFDPDLDTGSSPSPEDSEKVDGVDRLGASIEERTVPFEKQKNWMVATTGMLRNTPDGGTSGGQYYLAAGIRYGYDIGRRIFVTRDERLDTFTLEAGVFFYSISGIDADSDSTTTTTTTTTGTDSYNIAPIELTGRYTYYLNEDFGFFGYGGFVKNNVISSSKSLAERVANLSQVLPSIGVGALLRVGPQWYTRIDAGLDMISANLMIRF